MRHQENSSSPFLDGSILSPSSRFRNVARKSLAVLSLALAAAGASAIAYAGNGVRAVRLSNVVGAVQILNGTETQFSQAYPNMPLMQGSTLKTGEDGRAEIQFEDGSVARMTPNTSATLSVLSRNSEGNTDTELDLMTGLSYVVMSGAANQRFSVHFGSDEVISAVPARFRVNLDANPSEFAVLDGTAHLTNGSAYAVDVKANETVRFDATDSGRYFLAQGVDGDSWDQWNTDRDQAMGQMAAQETREARGSMNPNDPAWSDLDYYGNWYNAPGGGSFWSPSGMGTGWDPYGSGAWGYYGGAGGGYSWISGYPWGWLPYHCGGWNYYNNYGWGWMPGQCGQQWSPYSGIGNAPSGYRPLQRPIAPPKQVFNHGGVMRTPVNRALIAVDRGPEATSFNPRAGLVNKPVIINGQQARMLPKTFNTATTAGGTGIQRPSNANQPIPSSGAVMSGRMGFSNAGNGQQPGNTPVYRPAAPANGYQGTGGAPSAGYRPAAPSFSSGARPSGGQFSSSRPSAPSGGGSMSSGAHASSGVSSMPSSSASAPSSSSGGGHVK